MMNNEDKLFLLPDGRPLKRDRLEKRLKVLTQKAGLSGSWHSLRRGCLTYYSSKGAPMPYLQILAGHSSILTTQTYINPCLEEVLESQKEW